jgi:hypothetical protein
MAEKEGVKYYHVTEVGPVDGPVGMDIGVWLNFETDQGKITLKLAHEDAELLQKELKQEKSLAAKRKKS